MKRLRDLKLIPLALILSGIIILTGCGDDDDDDMPTAAITIGETGSDIGGDVTGDGGDATRTETWNNSSSTAEWNMDITAAAGGSFQLIIEDADGTEVLNQTLTVGVGDDSRSGVTSSGTSGSWTITVTVTDFNGDGSFSISPGD